MSAHRPATASGRPPADARAVDPADDAGRQRTSVTAQTLLICALIGTTQMTWGTIVPALPLYLERFGATALVLGPIIAAFGFGRAIVNIPAGIALRWWRPRPFLHIVCWLLVIVTAATGLSPTVPVLVAARVVAGLLGGAAITVGFAVLVAGAPADRRGRVMSTATAVQMSAGALGAFLGGLALSVFPLPVAFAVAVVPLVGCLLWDLARPATTYWAVPMRVPARSRATVLPTQPPLPLRGQRSRVTSLIVALALASVAAFFARFAGEQGLIPLLGYAIGGLTPFTLGLALALATIVSLGVVLGIGRLLDRGGLVWVFLPSIVISALAMLVFPFAAGPVSYALVMLLFLVTACVASVVPSVLMSQAIPPERSGFVVGVTRTAGDAGAVVGPLVALAVYDGFGALPAVGVIAAVILLGNAPLVWWLLASRQAR
ncbi:MFS transporter [Plantibacter flavus]|uniref:MFS transporter n=1 Tax=Plantibacter flavus TaxID=150123 RepID=UPI003F18C386